MKSIDQQHLIHCDTQEELDTYWEKLSEEGSQEQCGWLKDRYGVSWQVVPRVLDDMLLDEDAARAQRVMEAMLPTSKLDLATLEKAYNGG